MSTTRALARLYPLPLRERWGAALEADAEHAGWRAWPSLLAGLADMWLHPAVWPARSRAERRRRAAVLAVSVTAAAWFAGHVATEFYAVPRGARVLNACALLTMAGLALVGPFPRPTAAAAITVARRAVRYLAVPAVLGGAVVALVHVGPHVTGPLRPAALVCWWLAQSLGAVQTCRLVSSLGLDVAVPPQSWRLRLGMAALAAATAVTGAVLAVVFVTARAPHTLPALAGVGLLLLAPAFIGTLRDLRDLPAPA